MDHPSASGDQAGLARAVGAAVTADAELLSEVLDSLELDILVVDRRGVVIAWNRGFEARVAPRAAVLGRPIEDALARFTRAEWGVEWAARIRAEVLGGGRAVEIRRYPQRAPGGELLLFDVRADPIRDRGGAIHGAVLSMREVTDRARLEAETLRRETASELAHLGASVAHEIRNPLNSIGMNAQLLREELAAMAPGVSLLETADLIVKEIRRLNGVVTTFLTYARHPALRSLPDDPNAAVRQAVRLLEAEARAVAVTLVLDLGELPRIPLDRDQLAQGVYNLVLNGIQELAGGGVLTVTTRHERDYVLIEVTDTGRGIPPEDRERIFELFRTTREGGTGLGLPITRRIVEDHGGRITADNVPDGGGRFRIYLPVEAAGHRPPPAQ